MNIPCTCPVIFEPATTYLSNTKFLPPVLCHYPYRRPKNCRSYPVLLKEITEEGPNELLIELVANPG